MAGNVRSYHFTVGDSGAGPLGLGARIHATSKEEALEILLDELSDDIDAVASEALGGEEVGVDYVRIYLNKAGITVNDIDEVNDVDDDGMLIE